MEYAELYSSYPYFMFTVYSSYAAKTEGYDEVYIWLRKYTYTPTLLKIRDNIY